MPFLRMPEDNTLGETLGNLGASLGQALNPMNQIRAQDILAQVQQRRWEIQQQQRNDAANQNAAAVFRNANPLGLDDASREAAATAISQGRYDPSMWVGAATGLSKQRAAQAAADTVATDPDVSGYTPAEQASVKSLVLNGTPLADAKSQVANERMTAAKTAGALGARDAATNAASMPGADPEAAALAGSAALSDPTAAEKLIEAQRSRIASAAVPSGTLPSSPLVQEVTSRQLGAGQPVTPPAATQPARTAIEVGGDIAKAQAAPRPPGEIVAPTTFDPSTGAVNAPTPPSGPATTVPAQGPNTGATSATAAADEGTKYRMGEVQKDMASGTKAYQLLRTTALLREYAGELDNNTPWDQAKSAFMNRVFDGTGITFTPGQSAREAFTQISKQLMGAARTDDGIQRVAGPEITVLNAQMPNAQQDRASLMRALDQLETKSRRLIEEGRVAGDLYGSTGGNIDAKQFSDYTTKRNQIETPPTMDKPVGTPDTTPTTGGPTRPKGVRIFRPDGTLLQGPPPQ